VERQTNIPNSLQQIQDTEMTFKMHAMTARMMTRKALRQQTSLSVSS